MSILSQLLAWIRSLRVGLNTQALPPPDTTPPTIVLHGPLLAVVAAGPILLVAEVDDNVRVTQVDFYRGTELLGSRSLEPWIWEATIDATDNGNVPFHAVARDAASLRTRSLPLVVTVGMAAPDTFAPTAKLVVNATNFTAQGTLTLICTATDDRPGPLTLRLERDGLSIPIPADGIVRETITRASNGTHTYILFATDAAGNGGSTSQKITINIPLPPDVTPPVIQSFTMPGRSGFNVTEAGFIPFKVVATDDQGIKTVVFYVDNVDAAQVATAPYQTSLEFRAGTKGIRQIRARVYDAAFNFTDAVMELNVDIPAGTVVTPPAGEDVVWEMGIPAFNLRTGNARFTGRNFWQQAAGMGFNLSANGGYDSPYYLELYDCIIRTNGTAIGGYRGRVRGKNVTLIIDWTPVAGQSAPRPIDMQEWLDWEVDNLTIIGGSGNYFSGLNGQFHGDASKREGFKGKGFRFHNPDGRRSDGNGGYIKSNWGSTHSGNQIRINGGGVIGWDVANWVQFNGCPGMFFDVDWVEVLCELGKSRTEDTGSFYGGAGCSPGYPGKIQNAVLDTSGAWDWDYVPGSMTPYDASGEKTAGATGYQNPGQTQLSATACIIGDGPRAAYADNSGHITLRRVIGIGARGILGINYAHDITLDTCQTHRMAKHWSGVPYAGYTDGFFQINPSGATGTTPNGPRQIYGGNKLLNCYWGDKFRTTTEAYTLNAEQLQGGGVSSGNLRGPPPEDGGRQLILDLRARAAAEGQIIGSSLPVPAGFVADVFAKYVNP